MSKKKGKRGNQGNKRNQAKRAQKRKQAQKARRSKAAATPAEAEVIDLGAKRLEKIGGELQSLTASMTRQQDEKVSLMVTQYRAWEQANPKEALKPHHKLAMVRYGFVGPGGFARCHEPGRLPEQAFFLEDYEIDERIRRDHDAAEVLMCPAMQSRKCRGVWRGMKTPPCHLLLLEIYDGLGGGAMDDSLDEVADDWGKWGDPDDSRDHAESFARAEAVLAEHDC